MGKIETFRGIISKILAIAVVSTLLLSNVGYSYYPGSYKDSNVFLSEVKEAQMKFSGMAVKWHQQLPAGTDAEIDIRFRQTGNWSKWNKLVPDDDDGDISNYPVSFISTAEADAYQYKIVLKSSDKNSTPVVDHLEFTYLQPKSPEIVSASLNKPEASFLGTVKRPVTKYLTNVKVIPRSEWGADESLRLYKDDRPQPQLVKLEDDFYEKYKDELKIAKKVETDESGKKLTWPLEYPEKISKIIIHHTATTKNLDDPKKAIQAIYYWHAISRGWGDIGYNYIIDPEGNIYEGRYGGEGVIGAHAGRGNNGSIGIAILGDYQNNEVPQKVIDSLVALIKEKANIYGIDVEGSSSFRGQDLPNVFGHREIMSTTCPGEKLNSIIPNIREMAKGSVSAQLIDNRTKKQSDYDFALATSYGITNLKAGTDSVLNIKLKNIGTKAWNAASFLMLSNSAGRSYIDTSTIKSQKAGKSISPGSSATFTIPLKVANASGFTNLEIFPMIDGDVKVDKYIRIPVRVNPSNYGYEFVSLKQDKTVLKSGEKSTATIILKNTGDTTWKRSGINKIMIGAESPRDHISTIIEKPGTRLAEMVEKEVKPGQTAHFKVYLKAPKNEGSYEETFAPVIEAVKWLPLAKEKIKFYVADADFSSKMISMGPDNVVLPGEKKTLSLKLKNTGTETWNKKGKNAFSLDVAKTSGISVSSVLNSNSIIPGQTADISVTLTAPKTEGKYTISFTPKSGANKLSVNPLEVDLYVRKSASSENYTKQNTTGNIKVGLGFTGNPVISADGQFKVYTGTRELATFNRNEKVTVTYEKGTYHIKGDKTAFIINNPPKFAPINTAILRIDNYENHPAWKTELNDNQYRGTLQVHYYDSKLVVVNELPLEDYLKGLAEISASEPMEKIKSIIVLARSYAKYYATMAEKFPGAPYNLTDDPARSQYYVGYGFEIRNPTGVKAVNETNGEVVTYNGKLIKTPYFSADDGKTRSAEEVWGWKDAPYLVSVDDPGCKGQEMRGHGVGLSGCGALYFANQGKNYKEIIKYYFKGVEISKQ